MSDLGGRGDTGDAINADNADNADNANDSNDSNDANDASATRIGPESDGYVLALALAARIPLRMSTRTRFLAEIRPPVTAPIVLPMEGLTMKTRQPSFEFRSWGGARAGAGRKPSGPRDNVTHATRPELNARHPVHVTLRIEAGLESLRRRKAFHVVRDALVAACSRFGTRLVHFSVLTNHVHLICEALDGVALSRAMKGLGVRIAKGLNRLWARTGSVIADRYHARVLGTPREVRNALTYVLHNARRHGAPFRGPDPCSSGVWFEGWERVRHDDPLRTPCPLPQPRTWLLAVGWKRHGPIRFAR